MYIRVNIDKHEILEELTDKDLREELESRSGVSCAVMSDNEAAQSLIDASDFCRKNGRLDLAARLDEIRKGAE